MIKLPALRGPTVLAARRRRDREVIAANEMLGARSAAVHRHPARAFEENRHVRGAGARFGDAGRAPTEGTLTG
jgi:hypothetical protein